MKLTTIYRIEDGILKDTEIEPILGFYGVKYPHRKTRDLYVPPMKMNNKEIKTWHCCQENCKSPDFEGSIEALLKHLLLHKGRLLKQWNKKHQLKSPIPAVQIPQNEYTKYPQNQVNQDRAFILKLYIDSLKAMLNKQGIEVIELEKK